MSDKKRKRESDGKHDRPRKKPTTASAGSADSVKVSLLQNLDEWTPLLASTPGISLPPKTTFKPYTKSKTQQTDRSSTPATELLLHSSSHPKLDYVAHEEASEKAYGTLKHYIGVYDPHKDTLQLLPTRKLIVRTTLKRSAPIEPDEDDVPPSSQGFSARSNLSLEFGTKKSQKAIRSLTENAISPSKGKTTAAEDAIMDSIATSTADMPTREDMQAEAMANKPIPIPNMAATMPAEVYTLDGLVGLQTLRSMQVKEWIDKTNAGEEVLTKSRFVSGRIRKLVKADEVKKLKAAKYMLLLLQWYAMLRKTSQMSKAVSRVPKREEWEDKLPGWDSHIIAGVCKRFTENGVEVNKWHTNRLMTHILAIALVIDDLVTDTHDVRDDLHLDNKEISSLYAEIGAPLSAPTEAELKQLKMTRTEAQQGGHRFARLKLPLQFPKLRVVGAKGARRR